VRWLLQPRTGDHMEVITVMVESGADLNHAANNGRTPLVRAGVLA
jgi:hypothetical protein